MIEVGKANVNIISNSGYTPLTIFIENNLGKKKLGEESEEEEEDEDENEEKEVEEPSLKDPLNDEVMNVIKYFVSKGAIVHFADKSKFFFIFFFFHKNNFFFSFLKINK